MSSDLCRVMILSPHIGDGGVRRYVYDLARGCVDAGVSVTLAAPDSILEGPANSLDWTGVDRRLIDVAGIGRLRRLVAETRPDCIRLVSGGFPPDTRLAIRLIGFKVPVLESLHMIDPRARVGIARGLYYRLRSRRRYALLVFSRAMRKQIAARLPSLEPILVRFRYGLRLPKRSTSLRDSRSDRFRFVTVSRLDERHKDIGVLLGAFAELRRRNALTSDGHGLPTLTVIGDGPDRFALEAIARHLDVSESVTFHGWDESPFDHMEQADVFVLPTKGESFGRVNVEAAALSLPVIASRVMGCEESVVDGVNGLLVEPGNVSALCEAMLRLMRCDDERLRLARAGPAVAARFGMDRHVQCTLRLAQRLRPRANRLRPQISTFP